MSADQTTSVASQSDGGPAGLRGWLVLPLFGLAICPLALVLIVVPQVADFAEAWPYLTLVQRSSIVFLNLTFIVSLAVAPIALLYLAYKRLEIFPRLFIIWIWAAPAAAFVATFVAFLPFREVMSFDEAMGSDFYRDVAQSVIQATIWTLYMRLSRRVENTFVN